MNEIRATMTTKGRITIPREVRQWLGLQAGDGVVFRIDEANQVTLRKVKYPTIASLAGAAGKLESPPAAKEILDVAREDAFVKHFAGPSTPVIG